MNDNIMTVFYNIRKLFVFLILAVFLSLIACKPRPTRDYGVFIGMNEKDSGKMMQYSIVVIEPSEFSAEKIERLHDAGKTVYGYLNIGSVEEYRPYYDLFKELRLGVYENWPDENWVDAASPDWQKFIIYELGKKYADMGFDGFFLDNADVFYFYPTEEIFSGLCEILCGLGKYNLKLMINGGDTFVSRCISEGTSSELFDGINQETVFTSIDFDNHKYGIQAKEETEYFKNYLEKAKECGLSVYLLEYRADRQLSRKIDLYCKKNGFLWYNAEGIELD